MKTAVTLLVVFAGSFVVTHAQSVMSLSVTPTLFEMSANPGQVWQSSVKVVNSNAFPITIYPSVVNFEPQGEAGHGKLLPVLEQMTEGTTLAEWIDIERAGITIAPESSQTIPFFVDVPEDAAPGGHFAAILISTQPPGDSESALQVRTTQAVSSLFFVRIDGDVIEDGSVRTFSVTESFSQVPEAEFALRFENKGNVHLQPRGDITIYNMWGKQRGQIPINHRTHFGNVLPDSIRNFTFTWSGEQSFADIGRYKAVATLGYGLGNTQFTSATTYFWVVPVVSLLITLGSVIVLGFLIIWGIRMYIRHMLAMAGITPNIVERNRRRMATQVPDVEISRYATLTAPVRSGVLDLKERMQGVSAFTDRAATLLKFVSAYRNFFLIMGVLLVSIGLVGYYLAEVTKESADFAVTIENPDTNTRLNAEEIMYFKLNNNQGLDVLPAAVGQEYNLIVINTSGVSGTAAEVAFMLKQADYAVTELAADTSRVNKSTVVVHDPALVDPALELSRVLGGVLVSARSSTSPESVADITIFVGEDQRAR